MNSEPSLPKPPRYLVHKGVVYVRRHWDGLKTSFDFFMGHHDFKNDYVVVIWKNIYHAVYVKSGQTGDTQYWTDWVVLGDYGK